MSQTETVMVLALGAALACVVFLLFGRFFWTIAMAAGARRRDRQIPVQVLELQAERDRMRAENALMSRKLDLKLDDIKMRMAEQMAEVSRNRNRVQTLLNDLESKDADLKAAERDKAALEVRVEAQQGELHGANQTIDALTNDLHRNDEQMARLQQAFRKLSVSLRDASPTGVNLSAELQAELGWQAPVVAQDVAAGGQGNLRRRVAELTAISVDLSHQNSADLVRGFPADDDPAPALPGTPRRTNELQAKVDEAARLSNDMEAELRQLDQMLANGNEPQSVGAQPAGGGKKGTMANVISLAQRIRALQQGINE